jgi:hypothetical protein
MYLRTGKREMGCLPAIASIAGIKLRKGEKPEKIKPSLGFELNFRPDIFGQIRECE